MHRTFRTLVLTAIMSLTACSSSDLPQANNSLLRFLSEEPAGVVFVDFGELRQNPFVQGFMEEYVGIQLPERLEDFTASTGFDPKSSLKQLMGTSVPDGNETLMAVSATFDRARVTQYMTDAGLAFGEDDDVPLFRPDPQRDTIVAFLDGVVLVGGESQVRDALERSRGNLPSALDNAQLLADINAISDGYQVWATGRLDSGGMADQLSGPLQLIRSIDHGTYQMRIDELVTARAVGHFSDPAEAETVAGLLQGLRGVAMLQGVSNGFGELLSGILISKEESSVEVRLQVETAVLERLAKSGALSR